MQNQPTNESDRPSAVFFFLLRTEETHLPVYDHVMYRKRTTLKLELDLSHETDKKYYNYADAFER